MYAYYTSIQKVWRILNMLFSKLIDLQTISDYFSQAIGEKSVYVLVLYQQTTWKYQYK